MTKIAHLKPVTTSMRGALVARQIARAIHHDANCFRIEDGCRVVRAPFPDGEVVWFVDDNGNVRVECECMSATAALHLAEIIDRAALH